MSFPNVDLMLLDLFEREFLAAQADAEWLVEDVFADRSAREREGIQVYLTRLRATQDLSRQIAPQEDGERTLFLVPSYPMFDLPFPQIGVTLATETGADRWLGDATGEVRTARGIVDGVECETREYEYGYWASGQWQVDVAASSKPEAVWLASLCRRFILGALDDLDAAGVKEVTMNLSDVRVESEQIPVQVFGRRLTVMAGRVAHTWWKRKAFGGAYAIGENLALEGLR